MNSKDLHPLERCVDASYGMRTPARGWYQLVTVQLARNAQEVVHPLRLIAQLAALKKSRQHRPDGVVFGLVSYQSKVEYIFHCVMIHADGTVAGSGVISWFDNVCRDYLVVIFYTARVGHCLLGSGNTCDGVLVRDLAGAPTTEPQVD